ncbi:MAG: DNA primase [Melioribacteraceae bacterium]|nr:DNA primase [Melioribacteraceae bacterium]MCF8354879.1 DNA primase [Melioribacteraceae bacterium]MCF8393899.1 DNA primase [Melioribacteraceae bacterium]MCF8419671.1 DNA primase [Melioribacteraceae bacterium]
MRIPEQKIEEIRSSVNIVDIISGFVQLRKRGKNFIGLCPFHQEKTPSFTVSEEKQIFHCFGCHAGGNVFKFLMDYKSISFIESVKEAAESVGIQLEYESGSINEKQSELEELYEINVLAAKYFSNNLLSSDSSESAREYLKKRSIKPQTQKIFGLGYAFPLWDHFLNYAKENQIDLMKAKTLGLIDTRDDGSFYDKFRGRVIYPIFSPNGRVIAFGGRVLDNTAKTAKYLNSPESEIYHKRNSLYGLFHSKDEIRKLDRAILVEGYMDVIALFQHGVKNIVASSGTSLTDEQVQLLSRFTRNITVIFDADEAGQRASMRNIEILLKQNFDVKVIALPDEEDPDSYINQFGKKEFEDRVDQAKNFLEYQTARFDKLGMFADPGKQTEAIRELVKSASLVSDELKRNLLIKNISKKFNLREKLIESELDNFLKQNDQKETRAIINRQREQKSPTEKTNDQKPDRAAISLEKDIIKLLFEGNDEILGNIFDHIHPEDFTNKGFQRIAKIVYDCYTKDIIAPAMIIEKIEEDKLRNYVLEVTLTEDAISKKQWEEITNEENRMKSMVKFSEDIIRKYRIDKINMLLKENSAKIAETKDGKEIVELLNLNKELTTEKKSLQINGKLEG